MRFTKAVTTSDKRDCFLIVHGHAFEGFTNVDGSGQRIGYAIRSFRIDINKTHLYRSKRILEMTLAGVTFVFKPDTFFTPINCFVRFPSISAPATEAKRLKSHRFKGNITSK